MPARSTLPAVGACTWASGSQVCSGNSGTLMAKPANRARKIQSCIQQAHADAAVRPARQRGNGERQRRRVWLVVPEHDRQQAQEREHAAGEA